MPTLRDPANEVEKILHSLATQRLLCRRSTEVAELTGISHHRVLALAIEFEGRGWIHWREDILDAAFLTLLPLGYKELEDRGVVAPPEW